MYKLLTLGLTVLFTLNSFAQQKKHSLSPEQIAELKTKKMALHLELTDEQQEQIFEINRKTAIDRQQKIEERRIKGQKKEKLSTDELVQRKSAALDKQIALQKAMKDILTAEQYTIWKKVRRQKALALKKRRIMHKRIKMHRKILRRKMNH